MTTFKTAFVPEFSLKDLGAPHHFLGMEIIPTSQGLFLSQRSYVQEQLLHSTNMQDPVSTPLSTSCDLTPSINAPTCDAREYLDLSLVRMCPSQSISSHNIYMQAPTDVHMQSAKPSVPKRYYWSSSLSYL